jgi:segregation and condensation protein A
MDLLGKVMDPPESLRPARLRVWTPIFEGPLDLLLGLVEREELDILAVPLAQLTDAYLGEIASLPEADPQEMVDFLWMAARLLLLKSIRLLPGQDPTPEEADLLDWEEDVRLRLQEYRTYKQLAEEWMGRRDEAFSAPTRLIEAEGQEHPIQVDLLFSAFQSVLARIPPRPLTIVRQHWTLDQKLTVIRSRLARGPLDLVEMLLESEDRLEAVVTFVALLELLRLGRVRVRQQESFGSIWVEPI